MAAADTNAPDKFLSIVLLLNRVHDVTRGEFTSACRRALGFTPDPSQVVVPPEPPHGAAIMLVMKGSAIGLVSVNVPYVPDPGAAAERLSLFELKRVMQKHRAWLALDWVGDLPPGGKEQAYSSLARLIAEFIDDDCLGIYGTEIGKLNVVRPNTARILRSANPLAAFEYDNPDTIVMVKPGNQLAAAEAEARRRWPEFVAAFAKKHPMQGFAVKAAFPTSDESLEHIWVEVNRMDARAIHGVLANEPADIPGKKIGDKVTVAVDAVEDWIFQSGNEMVGGFTSAALRGET